MSVSGRSSGTGKYSYCETSKGPISVLVAHMPEDGFSVRIVFKSQGEAHVPAMKLGDTEALLLCSSLMRLAKDLEWDFSTFEEQMADFRKKNEELK